MGIWLPIEPNELSFTLNRVRRAGRTRLFYFNRMEKFSASDIDAIQYASQHGFFSLEATEAFERHLKRLYESTQRKFKGQESNNFSSFEPLWY